MTGLLGDTLQKLIIWGKATTVAGFDPAKYRKDRYGFWIEFDAYGKTSDYGWEYDHIHPASLGGLDHIENLQPLHWRNNRVKSNRLIG